VKGFGNLFFGQFIVLMADETATHVGGCSTDSSVRMIKAIENKFGLHLFDRQLLAFLKEDNIQLIPYQQVNYAYANGFIDDETIYFNNLVDTKKAMEENWMIPLRNSWLAKNLTSQVS
jgi:glyceraldehyde-3-phosphate dehydrogenase/erythrose-4-phosphate dehydrogenase